MKIKINKKLLYFTLIFLFLFFSIYVFMSFVKKDFYLDTNENKTVVNSTQIEISKNLNTEMVLDKHKLDILVVGDIMTDRYIRKQVNRYDSAEGFVSNYLNNLREINKNYDYVVANLEGPITENKSKTLNADGSYGKDLLFTFPTSTTEILNLLNIKVLSLANNHTDNFYNAGYVSTKIFLEKANINYFGNPYNDTKELSKSVCQNSICVSYIGYNQFTLENSSELIVQEIKKQKSDPSIDFVVIMPHWGEEYDKIANTKEISLAYDWIEAGADLVVGAHPHVIQNSEVYKGKYIYYSLGNYIFDQWFSKDVQRGLGINIIFEKNLSGNIGSDNYKVEKSIRIKEENNKNIFIDRDGVRYK